MTAEINTLKIFRSTALWHINRRSGAKQRHFCLEGAIKTIIGTKTVLVFLHMKLLLIIHSSFVIYYCLYISYYEVVDGVYRES